MTPELKTLITHDEVKSEHRLNILDRAISFFNPEQGVKRLASRQILHQFGFDDSHTARGKSGGMYGNASGENWAKNRDRLKAMWSARDLVQYDWIGGMISRVTLYVCGTQTHNSKTGDEQIDEMYNAYWKGWAGDEPSEDGLTQCDITGRHNLSKMVQLAFMEFLVDGDHGIIEVDPEFSPTKRFCLQQIEADRIGSPLEAQVQENYIGGITLDPETGRIQTYRVFHRTRTNQYNQPKEVDVGSFIHVMDTDRADEYRGRTKLLRMLNDVRDIREWCEAEKIAGKTQSQWAAMVGTKDPFSTNGPGAWSNTNKDGTPTQDAAWGKILKMSEGENFSMLSPSARPSGAFMAFVQMLIRKMAVSLDLPYGFLWDLASLGGVTARIEVQQALRRIQYWQKNIITDKILTRVRNKVIAQGIANQEIQAHPNWRRHEWHFGPWISTDVGYESEVDIQSIQTGIASVSEVTAKHGKTPREIFQSNAATANEAIAVGAENEVPVEAFAPGLYPNLTQQKAAMHDSLMPPPPPPKPGSLEAIGEKGVSELVKIIQSVKDGKLDRDSAINTLMMTFHLSRKNADDITPPNPTKAEIAAKAPQAPDLGKQAHSKPKKR